MEIKSEDGIDEYIKAYRDVYDHSWKKIEPFPGFIDELIKLFAKKGFLRLGIASIEGGPIAAQIWIVENDIAYIYKLAYNKDFKQYSAGTILTAHLMEYVIDTDNVNEVDYLIGDDDYKKDWMNSRREMWGILAYNPKTVRGQLGYFNERVRKTVKRMRSNSKF